MASRPREYRQRLTSRAHPLSARTSSLSPARDHALSHRKWDTSVSRLWIPVGVSALLAFGSASARDSERAHSGPGKAASPRCLAPCDHEVHGIGDRTLGRGSPRRVIRARLCPRALQFIDHGDSAILHEDPASAQGIDEQLVPTESKRSRALTGREVRRRRQEGLRDCFSSALS